MKKLKKKLAQIGYSHVSYDVCVPRGSEIRPSGYTQIGIGRRFNSQNKTYDCGRFVFFKKEGLMVLL